MARNPVQEQSPHKPNVQDGSVQMSTSGPSATPDTVPQGERPEQLLSDTGRVVGSVVKPEREEVSVPKHKSFVVMKTGTALHGGMRVTLNEGKVVTDAQYDILLLKRSGVKLREMGPDEE